MLILLQYFEQESISPIDSIIRGAFLCRIKSVRIDPI